MESRAILYGFWLSSCSWRVRAALKFKGILFVEKPIDIIKEKKQLTDEFKKVNPIQKVPAIVIDGNTIIESMAILQYLEDTRPTPSLNSGSPITKARVREICEVVVSGIQPLQNVGLRSQFPTHEEYVRFTKHWTAQGLTALEQLIVNSSGKCCVGDQLSLADICLVPQLYNAVIRHKLELSPYPTVSRLYEDLLNLNVFKETHPSVVKQSEENQNVLN